MLTELNILKDRPQREPDIITPAGGYVWFDELLYYNGSRLLKLAVCNERGLLRLDNVGDRKPCKDCDLCSSGKEAQCNQFYLKEQTQKAYKLWHEKKFEELILDEKDDI
jgi:hypothetical protein